MKTAHGHGGEIDNDSQASVHPGILQETVAKYPDGPLWPFSMSSSLLEVRVYDYETRGPGPVLRLTGTLVTSASTLLDT